MNAVCGCGCGAAVGLAPRTRSAYGWIKGQPKRFINTHASRLRVVEPLRCADCGTALSRGAVTRCLACQQDAQRADGLALFWSKVDRSAGAAGCWPWTGYVAPSGYGQASRGLRGNDWAHRIAFESAEGPVPVGLELDHVCHSADAACPGGPRCAHRRCCNPAHLEAVTHLVNVRRSRHVMAVAS